MHIRSLISLITLLFALTLTIQAQSPGKLTIQWEFKNVEEGYDHLNKMEVYVDGVFKSQSSSKKETQSNKMRMKLNQGSYMIRIVNLSLYEGNWEEHSIENDYSIDCLVEDRISVGKNTVIKIVFDLDSETTFGIN